MLLNEAPEAVKTFKEEGRVSRKEDIARKTALLFPQPATGVLSLFTCRFLAVYHQNSGQGAR